MPFFRFLLEGTNLQIPVEGATPVIGFFTTRVVWANTRAEAEAKALQSVRDLWTTGRYAATPSAAQLTITGSETGPANLWSWLRAPSTGHAFFASESAEA